MIHQTGPRGIFHPKISLYADDVVLCVLEPETFGSELKDIIGTKMNLKGG